MLPILIILLLNLQYHPRVQVMFEGFDGEPEPENKVAKKKIFDKWAPDLKPDGDAMVIWKGVKSVTSAGVYKAVNVMSDARVS